MYLFIGEQLEELTKWEALSEGFGLFPAAAAVLAVVYKMYKSKDKALMELMTQQAKTIQELNDKHAERMEQLLKANHEESKETRAILIELGNEIKLNRRP